MTPNDVSERIYDALQSQKRNLGGIVLPTTALSLAAQILLDIIASEGMAESTLSSSVLGESLASIVERVRPLLPADWKTTVLEDASGEILHHVTSMLRSAAPRRAAPWEEHP